jgi:5'-nucleotidase
MSILRLLGAAGVLLLVLASPAAAHKRHHHHQKPKDVKVQLLALNDFHGNLQTTTTGGIVIDPPPVQPPPDQPQLPTRRAAGGAAILGSYVRELERGKRNSLLVSAGDLIGASPLVSALYHDEPTIEAMNLLGLDLNAVGNHEFDEGEDELKRMQRGGCNPTDGCETGHTFRGANFKFLAANVVRKDNAKTLFKPYVIRRFQGKKIGFIGMTLEGTPSIVSPSGIANLSFLDEAATANRYARELRRKHGVKAIVVLLHEGGVQNPSTFNTNPATYTGCMGFTGPIVDIVSNTTDDVDLFITGHTHQPYDCVIDGRPVTSSSSAGRLLTDIDLTIGRNDDVNDVQANNIPMYPEGRTPHQRVDELVKFYEERSRPLRETVVGRIARDITRTTDPDLSRENALGNLIADAQLADTAAADRGDADGALMNPGGVRADLAFARSGSQTADGIVTYEEAFTVQPFNNLVTTQTFTGQQFLDVLKDQWCGSAAVNVLLPSSTIRYTWDQSIADSIVNQPCAGAPNPVSGVTIGGAALNTTASYRITTNNFLADGGDGFASLTAGTNRTTLPEGRFDIDSLVDYLQPSIAGAPIEPPALDRITRIP